MDDLDELFRTDDAEATPARAEEGDDLDELFAPEKPKRRRIEERGIGLADEIYDRQFKTRSGETVLPTLPDEDRERLQGMSAWERIKWRLANPASTRVDDKADLRIPQPNRIAVDNFINRNVDLKALQEEFGDEYSDSDLRRSVFEQLRARSMGAYRGRVAGTSEPLSERIAKRVLPVAGSAMSIVDDQYYKQSKERMEAGQGTTLDAKVIADYERSHNDAAQRGVGGVIADTVLSVPGLVGEGIAGLPAFVGSQALRGSSERSVQQGGEIYSPKNIVPATTNAAVQATIVGHAGKLAGGLSTAAGRIAGGTLLGLTEQQLYDVAAGKIDEYLPEEYRMGGKYGIAGQLARGELSEAGKNVLQQAITFGAFSGTHELSRQKGSALPAETAQPNARGQISPETAPVEKPADTPIAPPDAATGPKTGVPGGAEPANLTGESKWKPSGTKFESTDGVTTFSSKTGEKYTLIREGTDSDVVIKAVDANGKVVGRVNFEKGAETFGGGNAGEGFAAGQVWVSPSKARQGISTALYDYAAENVGSIHPSKSLSPVEYANGARGGGEGLWRKNLNQTVDKGDPNFVGLQHASIDARREGLDLPETQKGNVGRWEESMSRATELAKTNPERVDRLIEEIANGRAATQDEKAVVLHRLTEKDNALNKSIDALEKARESGDVDAIADAESARNKALDELDSIGRIASQAGTASGASLNFQKALAARDFSTVRMLARAERANSGEKLPTEVRTEVADLSKQLQESQKKIAELEDRIADMPAAEQRTGPPVNRINRRATTGKRLDDAWKEFQKVTQGRLFSGVPDSDSIVAGAKLVKAAVDHGVASVKDFVDWVGTKRGRTLTADEITQAESMWSKGQADIRTEENAKFKQRMDKSDGAGGRIAQELARDAIERGIGRQAVDAGRSGRDAIVDDVFARMLEIDPSITRRQVMDDISGYGDFKALNKDDIATELRDLKGQLQQVSKLEDMASGKAPAKTGIERRVPSAEERALIKQVNEAKKAGGFEVTDPESQLKSAMDAIKTRLRNQIEDLDRQIESGQKTIKQKTTLQYDQEATSLREQRDRLKAEFDEVFGQSGKSDAERLAVLKENIKNRNAELERRLREEDFTPPEKKPEVAPDEELLRERVKNKKLRDQFDEKLRTIENSKRSTFEKAFRGMYEVGNNVPKTLMSSIDAPLGRQALFSLLTHPVRTLKAVPESWRAFRSEDVAKRAEVRLENDPLFKDGTYQKMGIDFTKSHGEEGFFSKLFDKLPKALNYPGGSERAFRTLMNRVRSEVATGLVGSLASKPGGLTAGDLRVIGNFVNVTTGRLSPGALKQATQQLNFAFFAPQYTVSRLFTAIGQPLWHRPSESAPAARKLVAKEYAKAAMAVATVAGTLKTIQQLTDSKEFDVGLDPRSPDFLQARFGNTRIDLTGGLKAWYVLGSRLATGKTVNQEGLEKDADRRDILSQFAFQKSSPLVSGGMELLTGKDAIGREITPGQVALSKVSPVFARDVVESSKDLGLPKALVPWMLGVHGFGINTYSSDDKQLATLYRHAKKTPRPTRPAGMPVEAYREKVKQWETQKTGAQKLLDRSGKNEEEQRQIYNNQKKANRLKRVGRDAAAVPK